MLELLISNMSLPDPPQSFVKHDSRQLVESMFNSISAAKTLLNIVFILPQGEEFGITNIGWICLLRALTLGCRLDVLAMQPDLAAPASHLRQFLDAPLCIRQIILRLDSLISKDGDIDGEKSPYFHMRKRIYAVQKWYEAATYRATLSTSTPADVLQENDNATPSHSNLVGESEWHFALGNDISMPGVPGLQFLHLPESLVDSRYDQLYQG
jgi:hypothetical protein